MAITAYKHVTPAGAGAKTGADWTNAYGEPEFEAYIEGGGLAAGNVIFIKEGTYVLDSSYDSSAISGTATAPIAFIGVLAGTTNVGAAVTYADWATSANRPFFDCVTFQFKVGSYYQIKNLYLQGEHVTMLSGATAVAVRNCKFDNDVAVSAANSCCILTSYSSFVGCDFTSAKARGGSVGSSGYVSRCYFRGISDATQGYALSVATGSTVTNCIFSSCTFGIFLGSAVSIVIENNSFYICASAVTGSTSYAIKMANNLFEGCTAYGIRFTTQSDTNSIEGTHGDDARNTDMWNGVDTTTVFQDYEVTAGDPLFTTPGTDHSLQGSSPCLRTAEDISLGVGATVINGNKGAWQGFPEVARNTITDDKVQNGHAYQHLGLPEVGTLGAISLSSQSSRSDSSYSHSSHSDSSSSYSDSVSVSSGSTSVSSDSSPSSSSLSLEGDCIQAQITAKLKQLLETVTTANGYHYDVKAVEQARKVLEINNRWPFILLCENEPETDTDLVIRTIDYIVWFFGVQDDELTADNVKDHDNEIAFHNRNAIADITKAINANIYLDGFAENVEVEPGTNDLYVDGNTTLFGTWCLVRVTTNIDSTDPYKLR